MLARQCAQCHTESDFRLLVTRHVQALLPHGLLAAAIGRVDLQHVEILRFIGVNYPEAARTQLPFVLNLRERPVVARWLQTREPQIIDLPADSNLLSARERWEIETFGLGRLAIHSVVDLQSGAGTYFSFGQVPRGPSAEALRNTLLLLTPHLHQALSRVAFLSSERSSTSGPPTLTAIESEILCWLAAGRSNAEIAQLRDRSIATVRNQVHVLLKKLGAANRAEAVRLALLPRVGDHHNSGD